ncbi:hypothetical protein [Mycobacterium numidiamassiliense]|uniref:hypothetical protein n=1 Tax=Mycobacterium numidiamassiliense TaxID=1841861 RepID=UPI00105552D6|nr:hypothetical protein [Mycobacterium numidiamassiliense]
MSEHIPGVETVSLRELPSRLSSWPFSVENPLHRIEDVAGPFCCCHASQRSALIDCGNDLRNLGFRWFLRLFNIVDLLVVFVSQMGQVLLEAHHAVVGGFVRALFSAILFGYLASLFFALTESIAKIVGRIALLVREWATLGVAQHIREVRKTCLDISAV